MKPDLSRYALAILLVAALCPAARAQPVEKAEPVGTSDPDPVLRGCAPARPFPPVPRSLGQPSNSRLTWGPLLGYDFDRKHGAARLYGRLARPIFGSRLWWLDGSVEASVLMSGSAPGAAAGASVGVPWFSGGMEYRPRDEVLTPTLSLRLPLRRGGMLSRGDLLRIDYYPGRSEVLAGLVLRPPFEDYRMTRPRRTEVTLPQGRFPSPPSARAGADPLRGAWGPLEGVYHAIDWMDRLLTPRFDADGFERSALGFREHIRQPGHTFEEEDAAYHRGLDSAFAAVLGGRQRLGQCVAALAESVLFREVLAPYDRSFGQEKTPSGGDGLYVQALEAFHDALSTRRLATAGGDSLASSREAACVEVFRRVLYAVRRAARRAGRRWRSGALFWHNRRALAWIPLNYGLRPHQYDSQEEWDAVQRAVTGEPITDANTISYLMMEQFHSQLKRMIRETRAYQVTIIHDFRGRTPDGRTDVYGWDIAVDGYIAAFLEAVHDLDAGKRDCLPQFFLLLDANYYQANGSRGIMTFLEHLLEPMTIRFQENSIREQVVAAQAALREAVRKSPALRGVGERELREAFRVHVSVTNPFDPAFMLDVTRRDHRKIAFRDVFENDPAAGEAVFTGQGIGEHYNGTGWEDRGILVRGPSLLQLKSATRLLLLRQGFAETEIPKYLQPQPLPDDYPDLCARLRAQGWTTSLSILFNETGYGGKEATVVKAMIYNLAPRGSFILCFDSLWSSDFWAGMFVSASLRGANLLPVGPSPTNAPSAAAPTLHFLRKNLRLMIQARTFFAEDLERLGGTIRVGLYAHKVATTDFPRRARAFLAGRERYPFLRTLVPTHPSVDKFLEDFIAQYEEVPRLGLRLRPRPFLHMKSQLFATAEAFQLYGLAEWAQVLRAHMRIRQRQVSGMASEGLTPRVLDVVDEGRPGTRSLVDAFGARLDSLSATARSRAIFTMTIGSHNQNPRSMLLDGEALVAVSGFDSAIAAIDLAFILCVADWPSTTAEFDRLFPEKGLPFYLTPLARALKDQG